MKLEIRPRILILKVDPLLKRGVSDCSFQRELQWMIYIKKTIEKPDNHTAITETHFEEFNLT